MPARVLVIGLDSYETTLLRQWSAAGVLPCVRALMTHAVVADAMPPRALYAGSAWPSFSTAVSAAKHRRFFRRQAARGAYIDSDFSPQQLAAPAFWDTLSAAGRTVAVIDVPHTKLSPHFTGLQLIDWSVHEPELVPPRSNPAALTAELEARFGRPEPDHCDGVEQTPHGIRHFLHRLDERIHNKVDISLHCLAQAEWDLFVTVFGEAHCVGHQTWHLHDPGHPQHDRGLAQEVGDPMLTVYQALDAAVGRLLAAVGRDTIVVLLTVHGMGPLTGASMVLDEILRRVERREGGSGWSPYGMLKRAWYAAPPAIRGARAVRWLRSSLAPSLHGAVLIPERKVRQYFQIPNNPHAGAIRINLAGRESAGVVQPDAYRPLCAQLERELLALRTESGAHMVQEVVVVCDVYAGPFLDELPDLLVEWNRAEIETAITSPRVGTLQVPTPIGRTGDHCGAGMLLGRSPHGARGSLGQPVSVMDLGPTIAALLDVELSDVDGRVAPELLAGLGGATRQDDAGDGGYDGRTSAARYTSR